MATIIKKDTNDKVNKYSLSLLAIAISQLSALL